jgi:hypothetical protein
MTEVADADAGGKVQILFSRIVIKVNTNGKQVCITCG